LRDHGLRPRQPPPDLVAMRRGAGGGAEVAREREAVETGELFQFLRGHGAMGLGRQVLAGLAYGAMGRSAVRACLAAIAAGGQALGHALDHGIDGQRFERLGEVGEGFTHQLGQHRVVGNDVAHEGRAGIAEGCRHRGRIDIEHVVGEPGVDAGVSVMGLVGMQHHDLAGPAGAQRAAIVERLSAPQRDAHRISLVAVDVVGVAAEPRGQPLQAGAGLVKSDQVGGHARTFKTAGPACLIWGA